MTCCWTALETAEAVLHALGDQHGHERTDVGISEEPKLAGDFSLNVLTRQLGEQAHEVALYLRQLGLLIQNDRNEDILQAKDPGLTRPRANSS